MDLALPKKKVVKWIDRLAIKVSRTFLQKATLQLKCESQTRRSFKAFEEVRHFLFETLPPVLSLDLVLLLWTDPCKIKKISAFHRRTWTNLGNYSVKNSFSLTLICPSKKSLTININRRPLLFEVSYRLTHISSFPAWKQQFGMCLKIRAGVIRSWHCKIMVDPD